MKLRSLVLVALAAAVLVAGGALWWLWSSRDALVREAIEKFGPEITGVAVSVKEVKLEPLEGKGMIGGLRLGNPKGFEAPSALTLGEMRLSMDPASIQRLRETTGAVGSSLTRRTAPFLRRQRNTPSELGFFRDFSNRTTVRKGSKTKAF